MITNLFLYMMIAHLISDYYFQNENMANGKQNSFKKLAVHLSIYSVVGIVFFILAASYGMVWYFFAFILSHIVVDLAKFFVPKGKKDKPWVYVCDQLLHILSIAVIASIAVNNGASIKFLNLISQGFTAAQFSVNDFFKVTLLILLVLKPVNITFKKLYNPANIKGREADKKQGEKSDEKVLEVSVDKNSSKEEKQKELSLGATIGSMERLLIVILLLLNQYTAIGLVLTGKSVARYNKVSAEYYIVGTFFSLLSALIPYLIIMQIF